MNYVFVRLSTRKLNKYEVQRLERLVENLQRRQNEKDGYIYISLLGWKEIESQIVLRPELFRNLEVDLVNMPEESIQKGGYVGSEGFGNLIEKLPRDDLFHTQGDIEIDGELFWDKKEDE